MSDRSLYATVWRWHFIAGLLVLPFLVMMAVTGGAYLFKPQIDHLLYRRLENVAPRAAPRAPLETVAARVAVGLRGQVLELTPSIRADRAVRLVVRAPDGRSLTAFADPYDGHLIGATPYGGAMQVVRKIHSLQRFGFAASCLVEIAAGWSIVLVGTGALLWWPRQRGLGGVVTLRGPPSARLFWRDLHAVTGAFAGAVILFLAVTGMPWSLVWGAKVQGWATRAGLSEPPPPAGVLPAWMMTAAMPAMAGGPPNLPWAMERAAPPRSGGAGRQIGLDRAAAIFARLGVDRGPASIRLRAGGGVYAANWRPDRVEKTRVVYLDPYSGRVLQDVRFGDWGPAAKAIEWGIAVHQGQEYGWPGRLIMLAGCVAVVLLAASAVVMWWKRRPKGSLGVPPPADRRAASGFVAIVVGVGIVYPLVGLTLAIAAAIEWAVRRARPSPA